MYFGCNREINPDFMVSLDRASQKDMKKNKLYNCAKFKDRNYCLIVKEDRRINDSNKKRSSFKKSKRISNFLKAL